MVQNVSEENKKLLSEKSQIQKGKTTLQKRLAATKKHLIGSKRKLVESSTIQTSNKPMSSNKEAEERDCNTMLRGVKEPMVKILSSTSANFISVEQVYSGYSPGEDHVQSAGRRKYIGEIPIRQRNDCSRQELWIHANDGLTVLNFMSAADGSQDDEQ